MAGDILRSHRCGDHVAGVRSRSDCESEIWVHCSWPCYSCRFQPGTIIIIINLHPSSHRKWSIVFYNSIRSAKCCAFWPPIQLVSGKTKQKLIIFVYIFKILILKLRRGPTESFARSGEKQGTRCQEREKEVERILFWYLFEKFHTKFHTTAKDSCYTLTAFLM